tara:strand:- start:1205 stop:1918 length:714 start_codon:yes stop_codon:yes gene_type:complete
MSYHGMNSNKASQVKRGGHLREQIFSNQFSSRSMSSINDSVNFSGSSADCFITKPEFSSIIEKLRAKDGSTSVKGGNNYQFHLGTLPELVDYDTLEVFQQPSIKNPNKLESCFRSNITQAKQKEALLSKSFWTKYLGKGQILSIDSNSVWHFFLMEEVISLIVNQEYVNWRWRPTGRIKGDLYFKNGKKRAGITFEFRFEKKQFVLGAHGGGAGVKVFLPWLLDHITNVIRVDKMAA